MTDFFTASQLAVHLSQAKSVPVQHISEGVSMLTLAISNLTTAVIAGGLAWYIRGRGMTGVKIDIDNMKKEVQALKDKISGQVQTVV